MVIMTKIIVMYAKNMDWGSFEIYDSMEQLLKKLQDDWNDPELTIEEIKNINWQRNTEIRIVEGEYFPETRFVKNAGDDGSVGEELLMSVPEIEQQCWAVRQAVNGKYFTLEEALNLYKLTLEQYRDYLDAFDTN